MANMGRLLDSETDDVQTIRNLSKNFSSLGQGVLVPNSTCRLKTGFDDHADQVVDISEVLIQVHGTVLVLTEDLLAQL